MLHITFIAGEVGHMNDERVVELVHGDGGGATGALIEEVFLPRIGNDSLDAGEDAAAIAGGEDLRFTTDSFVVSPLEFPGGNIGDLAIHGTVNDLAVTGARPKWLSAGFILEEGLPFSVLERVLDTMGRAARRAGIRVVAADTKVVGRGAADGMFINTAGVGTVLPGVRMGFDRIAPGDVIVVTGSVGAHGIAVLSHRAGFSFETPVESDSAPLWPLVGRLLEGVGSGLRFMRDPTRGGLATVLSEMARASGVDIVLEEEALPIDDAIDGATRMLGLDPLYLACEGQAVMVVDASRAPRVLDIIRSTEGPWDPAIIGRASAGEGRAFMSTAMGGTRVIERRRGDPLPRIC